MKDVIIKGVSADVRVVIPWIRAYGVLPKSMDGQKAGSTWIDHGEQALLYFEPGELPVEQLDEAVRSWYGIAKAVNRRRRPTPFEAILDQYHRILPELPPCESLTDTRQTLIAARWLEHCADVDEDAGLARMEEFFNRVRVQPFLMGSGKRGWRASLTWLMKQENFAQTLEMAYAHKAP